MNGGQNEFDQIHALSSQAAVNLTNITCILQSIDSTDSETLKEFSDFRVMLEGLATSILHMTKNFLHKPQMAEILKEDDGMVDKDGC